MVSGLILLALLIPTEGIAQQREPSPSGQELIERTPWVAPPTIKLDFYPLPAAAAAAEGMPAGVARRLAAYRRLQDRGEAVPAARLSKAREKLMTALRQPPASAPVALWMDLLLAELLYEDGDLSGVQRVARQGLADHPGAPGTDRALYLLGFLGDEDSISTLRREHPDSVYASDAHMLSAESVYRSAILEGDPIGLAEAAAQYEVSLYGRHAAAARLRLLDVRWRQGDHSAGLSHLRALLSDPDAARYEPLALAYSGHLLSSLAEQRGTSFADELAAVGDERVYAATAEHLAEVDQLFSAVDVYTILLERYPLSAESPTYQWRLAELYGRLGKSDLAEQALARMAEAYREGGPWWEANRDSPVAQQIAAEYTRQVLLTQAQMQHVQAQMSGEADDYRETAELYAEVLRRYPEAGSPEQTRWLLADTLISSGQPEAALDVLAQLSSSPDGLFSEVSLYRSMIVRQQQLSAAYGDFTQRPEGAAVQERVVLPSGKERTVYALNEQYRAYIDAVAQVRAVDFDAAVDRVRARLADAEDDEQRYELDYTRATISSYGDAFSGNEPIFTYNIGKILFNHGQLELAQDHFQQVLEGWPEEEVALYSAKLSDEIRRDAQQDGLRD